MQQKINLLFSLLESHNIKYYLLRPLDFRFTIKDIDLIILKEEFASLKNILSKEFGQLFYKPSNANSSTQLLVNNVLLDIKFSICFLPRKSLVLNYDIPFSKVIYKKKYLLFPDVEKEKFFTFWVHHLFLDKEKPSDSSSFLVFKDLYSNSFVDLLGSEFFKESLSIIYQPNNSSQVAELFLSFFNNGMKSNEIQTGKVLKRIVIRNKFKFQIKYIYDKFKFGFYRRIGVYDNYRAIK